MQPCDWATKTNYNIIRIRGKVHIIGALCTTGHSVVDDLEKIIKWTSKVSY